ncbi:MAG: hypothetical protein Q3976_04825 [Corynebacterium sp.]|nr:hypothetical protein [Corynebacterium sp.]
MRKQVPAAELAYSEASTAVSTDGDASSLQGPAHKVKSEPMNETMTRPSSEAVNGEVMASAPYVSKREHIRRASGVVLGLALSYLVAGIIWAWLRPTYSVIPVGEDEYQLGNEANVEFHGYLWFLLLSTVVALIGSAWLISHRERWVNVPMYFWFSAWVLFGLFIMQASSNLLVDYLYPLDGSAEIRYAPDISLGALGYVLAPCMAAVTLWIGMLHKVGEDDEFVEPATSTAETQLPSEAPVSQPSAVHAGAKNDPENPYSQPTV